MKKIKIINPDCGLSTNDIAEREKFLNNLSFSGFQIEMLAPKNNDIYVDSDLDIALISPAIISLAKEASKKGADGIGVYCFSDPAVTALREYLEIPVIGAGQASMILASLLGEKIALITTKSKRESSKKMWLKNVGIDLNKVISIRGVDEDIENLEEKKLIEKIEICIAKDKPDVIVLGCLSYSKYVKKIRSLFSIPIVDPAFALLNILEVMCNGQISHSKKAYPSPKKKVRSWSRGYIE